MKTNISVKKQVWLAIILGTVSATGPLSMDMYLPALPDMAQSLHTQTSVLQLSLSACLIGLALGQLVVGPLSDRYGRKKPLIIGFALFGLVSLLISMTDSIYLLIGLRFIQGLAGSSGQVLSRAIARDLFSGPLLTKFYSMLSAVNGIFPVLSPVLGGIIIQFTSWQGIFIVLAIIGLLVVLALFGGIKETLPTTARSTGGILSTMNSIGDLVKNDRFLRMIISAGLVTGGLFSYISASSFVFQNYFHMSVQNFSFLYALNGIGIAVGSIIPGFFANRISESKQTKTILTSTLITSLLLIGSWYLFRSLPVVIILVFLIVTQFGILFTLMTSIVMNMGTQNGGSVSALFGLSQNGIGSLMSPLVGLFGIATYLPMAVAIMLCILLSLILFNSLSTSTSQI
ncbi:multidrug effflux MFS transporter [Lentilactobacillus sp. SPB1-3]|uniref:Multidrug effflux MFS transporter n=1 Tax=Lentilactobacillus terminaliae TaxID=3003483 RepID=A0ACD5DEY4_9LACO|nr:multidrug effflux MFS transporter [Lentilactobacillus sp. SPB1-3]MCZ0976294.1 multidrug effflux MFS transporter [Lentilactobacillus sp. SPB1-3]